MRETKKGEEFEGPNGPQEIRVDKGSGDIGPNIRQKLNFRFFGPDEMRFIHHVGNFLLFEGVNGRVQRTK